MPRSITARRAVALAVVAGATLLALTGCPNSAAIRTARSSGYMTDFARVYSAALGVVVHLYPSVKEDATSGVISTAWHHVPITTGEDSSGSINQNAQAATTGGSNPLGTSSSDRKTFFVRFDVRIVGGKPWRVRVEGYASQWDAGAIPVPLTGAAIPPWLKGRVDALYVAIYDALKRYAVPLADTVVTPVEPDEELEDLAHFGPIPVPAAEVVREVKRAAVKRDFAGLRTLLADDVVWSLGAEPGIDGAMQMWQADGTQLEAIIQVIDAGCRLDDEKPDDPQVSCPPAYSETPGYLGHRVGFARRGKAWKLVFFVIGD